MTAIDDRWPEERFYFRSDHYNFARKGVPILFFFNGVHPDYHQPSDSPDKIDSEKESRILRLLYYLGRAVGDAPARPSGSRRATARSWTTPRITDARSRGILRAMTDTIADFNAFRSRMNDLILGAGNLTLSRFFALDNRAYEAGALGAKTKEMLGLVSSLVLRCDDCVTYHVIRCREEGVTREEFLEIFSVGLVVGGSIVIPHLRRAMARLEELEAIGA